MSDLLIYFGFKRKSYVEVVKIDNMLRSTKYEYTGLKFLKINKNQPMFINFWVPRITIEGRKCQIELDHIATTKGWQPNSELQNLTSLGKGSPSLKQIRSVLTWGINILPSLHCYRWAQWLLLKHTVWKVLSHLEDRLLIIKIVCADNLGNFVEFWLVKLENCSHRHTHSHSSITWSS